ncbi:MAG: RsmE family RNA methyltransferase [Nitrospiraceae bacterium]
MPVFFITADQVQDDTVRIEGPLLHHLRNSLRCQVGEEIWLGDGARRRYRIQIIGINRRVLSGRVLERQRMPSSGSPALTIGQALLKGERMDLVIQKASELGAASLIPLVSRHVIARPRADRLVAQQQRWQRIALEAAQQAERWEVPVVHTTCNATEFFAGQPVHTVSLILSERGDGHSLTSVVLPCGPEGRVAIAVGPEGGWTKEERESALQCGFTPVTLGTRILRAETAALAAVSILQSRLGELG